MTAKPFAVVFALVVLGAISLVQSAGSAPPACLVSNERTDVGARSLQAAIDAAASGDTLVVKGACVGNSTINKPLTLQGVSNKPFGTATLDGGGAGAVLTLASPLDSFGVVVNDLTITHGANGVVDDGLTAHPIEITRSIIRDNSGFGVAAGGNVGPVATLTDSTVSRNGSGGLAGSRALFTVVRSTLRDNGGCGISIGRLSAASLVDSTVSRNAGCGVSTGGFAGASSASLTNSIVRDNGGPGVVAVQEASAFLSGSTVSGNDGPGIQLLFGAGLSLMGSTVSGNVATGNGGGVDADPDGSFAVRGAVSVIDSMISGNSASLMGGGIYAARGYQFAVSNSTISGNSAKGDGGGVDIADSSSGVTLTDSVVSGNSATSGGGIYNNGGSVTLSGTTTFTGNTPDNCIGVVGC